MNEQTVTLKMNERTVRALHSAVSYTLEKWTGQGEMDQEELFCLKPFLQGAIFEFDFGRKSK